MISIKWLEEILQSRLKINHLKKICLNLGLEIEQEFHYAPEGIVIGQIKKIAPHPSLKNLVVLEIRTNQMTQIVSAADNIKPNDFVLVGPTGAYLNGQKIEGKDFGGVRSQGVLVSEQELGLADKSLGVIVLEKGRPGGSFTEFFDDLVVEMKITPNRPDWLSVEGIARELAIGLRKTKLSFTNNALGIKQVNQSGNFEIKIQDLQGCPRYTARIFEGFVIKESPFGIKWRLHCMGMKAVNNIVDITNIVMLQTGQPLHPFDLDILKGGIIIRTAHTGEEFVTLEGTILKLSKNDLVICDQGGPIALAGVIGAKRSQISNATKRVLLESAYFNPNRVAHTSRHLGLITEASMRFERGGDILTADSASLVTKRLFEDYAQAKEVEFIGLGKKGKIKNIKFSTSRLNEILSLNLTDNQVKVLLSKIGVVIAGKNILTAKIPNYRRDLNIEEDIFEEIARVYGYMNIPETPPKKWAGNISTNKNFVYEEATKNYLIGQGFSETYNLSLIASRTLVDFGFEKVVKIRNPLNERFDALRPTLFPGLLECVNYNISKGNRSLKLFEVGNILLTEKPFQEKRLGVIMGGERYPNFWDQKSEQIDYYDAKGALESIFNFLHLKEIAFRPIMRKGLSQAIAVLCSGRDLGYLGQIEPGLCKEPYFYFELALEPMRLFISEPFYLPPAKFPANTRDLSFLVEEKVAVPEVIDLIVKVSGPVLEKINLFDYYKGDNLPAGKKNLGFRLYFRAPDRTLTDKEVDNFIKKVAGDVIQTFKAELRTREKNWTN